MSSEIKLNHEDVECLVLDICDQLNHEGFVPERIVGICPSGSIPATMLAEYYDIPVTMVSWPDEINERESNLWLPEAALAGKKLLVVDSISRTGDTFNTLCDDWESSIRGVDGVENWMDSVRFVALQMVENSEFELDYYAEEVAEHAMVTFPWEKWYDVAK